MLNMIEILQLVTPFSEQCSTTVPGQLPVARAHERDPVKDSTAGIKGLLAFFFFFKPNICTPVYSTTPQMVKPGQLKTHLIVPGQHDK